MTESPTAGSDFRLALVEARRRARAEQSTVLDVLRALVPATAWTDAVSWLAREAGVRCAEDPASWRPDGGGAASAAIRAIGGVALIDPSDGSAVVGLADPWDEDLVQRATLAAGHLPELAAATNAVLDLGGRGDETRTAAGTQVLFETSGRRERGGAEVGRSDSPVVNFVDEALQAGFDGGASDIHFECDRDGLTVKFRVDGVMQRHARMDGAQPAGEVISRIKVLSQLDITERRTPQDGRFRHHFDAGAIDLRVSIMPSVFGEDAVLRLLDRAQLRDATSTLSLERLGFDTTSIALLRDVADLPHGMLLVTGPTGSGKTTTVYALLAEINNGLEKIVTIEDPVEYELPGVLQIPVNDRKGLTFAKGLRSILRHDPDRILVGEIRDAETAEIAVQSALTGHQVLTTVHANSIFDVLGRFRHFGLDMYSFMSALNGVVVQRLLRQVCRQCVGHRPPTAAESQWAASLGTNLLEVPALRGCPACHGTGYKGRMVLAEVHVVDDVLRDLVIGQAPLSQLRERVAASGTRTLPEQAVAQVAAGHTTLEEVRRVVGWR